MRAGREHATRPLAVSLQPCRVARSGPGAAPVWLALIAPLDADPHVDVATLVDLDSLAAGEDHAEDDEEEADDGQGSEEESELDEGEEPEEEIGEEDEGPDDRINDEEPGNGDAGDEDPGVEPEDEGAEESDED